MNFFLSRGKAKVFFKTLAFSQLQAKKVLGGSRMWVRVWPRMGVWVGFGLGRSGDCQRGVDSGTRIASCPCHAHRFTLHGQA